MYEKYYTKEQLEALRAHREALGEDVVYAAETEWPGLIEAVRAEMAEGTDPKSPKVQRLARRWRTLIEAFSGGDPGLEAAARRMYANEPELSAQTGIDADLMDYIDSALTE